MANMNETTLASAIKTMYEHRLLHRAVPRLIHGRFGIDARINKFGSYELRKYGSLPVITASLAEGSTPAEQASPALTVITITPLFYGAWVGHTDILEMQAYDPVIEEASNILGEQCGVSADTLIRNVMTANATIDFSGGETALTSLVAISDMVTYADFLRQVAALENANALPVEGDKFVCIMHPFTWASLMQDPVFLNLFFEESEREGDSPLRSGYVGSILRTAIYVSSNVQSYAAGGAGSPASTPYAMLFIAKESYGYVGMAGVTPEELDAPGMGEWEVNTMKEVRPVEIIVKQLGSSGALDPLNQRATIGWKMSLATSVLNSAWIRNLQHININS
jgi:N4-gp56 family major capsid protein